MDAEWRYQHPLSSAGQDPMVAINFLVGIADMGGEAWISTGARMTPSGMNNHYRYKKHSHHGDPATQVYQARKVGIKRLRWATSCCRRIFGISWVVPWMRLLAVCSNHKRNWLFRSSKSRNAAKKNYDAGKDIDLSIYFICSIRTTGFRLETIMFGKTQHLFGKYCFSIGHGTSNHRFIRSNRIVSGTPQSDQNWWVRSAESVGLDGRKKRPRGNGHERLLAA